VVLLQEKMPNIHSSKDELAYPNASMLGLDEFRTESGKSALKQLVVWVSFRVAFRIAISFVTTLSRY
jgi:hypothetical protein